MLTGSAMWLRPLRTGFVVLAVLVGVAACGPRTGQILSFNYAVRTLADAGATIAEVQGGQTTVASLLQRDPCNFTANFDNTTPPQVFVNGTPGQTGFNVNIVSTDPVNLATTNPASCTALDEVEINIGGQNEALAVGGQTSLTNGRIWLLNGQRFDTSQYFLSRLDSFDASNRRAGGTFSFINRLDPTSNTVLIVDGSYSMRP
jgi:hypothetical protein